MRLLLVEDEPEMAAVLKTALEAQGFVVDTAATLGFARDAVLAGVHEIVLLDRQLPDGDGLDLLAEMRRTGRTIPVILLTASNMPNERIAGLNEGADDYIGKPFLIEELIARVRAAGRRSTAYQGQLLSEGNVSLDLTGSEVRVAGAVVVAPRREILVLTSLLRRFGRTVLRRNLEEAVYGYDSEIQSNSLDSHVSRLRKRLADAGADVEIHSVRGLGYVMKAAA